MGTNFGSIGEAFIDIRADLTKLKRDLRTVGSTIRKAGGGMQRAGRQVTMFLTAPILLLGGAAVKTASDVQEMINLFEVTFESASKDVEDWARVNAKAMQRSRFDMMQTASSFAAFLKPLGVAPKAIVPMSKALTALTTDLSSFRNIAEKDVFIRLFSGLAGETEAVRRLGIDIGVTSINAELLALGINKTSAEAKQSEKVIARFNLIMRQSTDAQGDAVRTALFFENQMRGLGATVKDVAVIIGQKLLPTATRMVQELRLLGQRFLSLDSAVQSGIIAIIGFVGVLGPAIIIIGLLLQAIGFAIAGFAVLAPVVGAALAALKFLFIGVQVIVIGFLAFFSTVPGLIITSLAAIIGGFFIFKDTIIGFFKGLVLAIKDVFVAGFHNKVVIPFQKAINELIAFLPDDVIGFLGLTPIEVSDVVDNNFKDDMKRVMTEAMASGKKELEDFKRTAIKVVGAVKSGFGAMKDAVSDFLPDLSLADLSLESIGTTFEDLLAQFTALTGAAAGFGDAVASSADEVADGWKETMETITASVEDGLLDIATSFKSFGDVALSVLRLIVQEMLRLAIIRPLLAFLGLPVPVPGLEHGGAARANKPAIVGEGGPELFVPNVSGRIIPNDRLRIGSGGDRGPTGDINQEFNFPLVFPTQLEAFVRNIAGPAGRDGAIQVLRAKQGKF